MFQPLDASLKLPDTPMANQFADDYIESVTLEPTVDVESAHLVIHAKVYAIAEKYVPLFVISSPSFLFLFTGMSAIFFVRVATFLVLRRAALRITAGSLRPPAMCVTGMVRLPILSRQRS